MITAQVQQSMVSVITIVYNSARFLSEAIESVLGQDYAAWELLVVDDGSTDESRAIAERYCASAAGRIRVISYDVNQGMSRARNAGLQHAAGKYVAFLDSDDIWQPTFLSTFVSALEAHEHVGLVVGPVTYWHSWAGGDNCPSDVVQDLGLRAGYTYAPPSLAIACVPLGQLPSPTMCGLMARRSAVLKVEGFEDEFRSKNEDYAFLLKMFLRHNVFVLRDNLAFYRQHSESCCGKACYEEDADFGYFLRWAEQYLRAQEMFDGRLRARWRSKSWPYTHAKLYQLGKTFSQMLPHNTYSHLARVWRNR